MHRFRNYVFAAAGFMILGLTVVQFTAPYAIAQVKALLIRDTDNPALQPFTFVSGGNWIGNAPNVSFFLNVPAGKRLVIEQASFNVDVTPSANQKVSVEILTTVNGVSTPFFFIGQNRGMAGTYAEFLGATQMRSYADPGGLQEILVQRADTSGGSNDHVVQMAISGYLVNVP